MSTMRIASWNVWWRFGEDWRSRERAIMFLAAAVRAFLGFGDAVVSMPLLAFVVGVRTAAPLVGLVGVILAAILVMRLRGAIVGAVAIRLVAATAVGVPIGVLAVARVPDTWSRQMLGLVLVAYGLHRLLASRPVTFSRRGWAWPFGFVAGCLGGAYNTSGPPVVVYATGQAGTRDRSVQTCRATSSSPA